jgi:hypothetical protein
VQVAVPPVCPRGFPLAAVQPDREHLAADVQVAATVKLCPNAGTEVVAVQPVHLLAPVAVQVGKVITAVKLQVCTG